MFAGAFASTDLPIATEATDMPYPSTLAGATVLINLSASNITIGKADYQRLLCASQSRRCIAAYAYAAAGSGESTTDLAWDGHEVIYENGQLLAETERFAADEQTTMRRRLRRQPEYHRAAVPER